MKRAFLMIVVLLASVIGVMAQEGVKSETIVFINGQRFYVHRVVEGETLYSLSALYGVEQNDIVDNNNTVKQKGLQISENIKIPIKESGADVEKEVVLDRKSRKNFDIHVVAQGETLYSISRKHAISVATIVEDNPTVDPSKLPLGQQILIRKKERGKTSEEVTMNELEKYKNGLNKVAPEGYEYYLVPPKETLYSLMRSRQMSRKEFFEVNRGMTSDELKSGDIVLVRALEERIILIERENPKADVEPQDQDQGVSFKPLRSGDTLNVSLLLPLTSSAGAVVPIFEEFYQGFLLGIEELKDKGHNVKVSLFNTQRSRSEVKEIVKSEDFKASNLIVGPVYEDLLGEVVAYAEKNSIPVVSPLATLQNSDSEVLFQMAPIAEHRYDKIGDILADSVTVTLIYTENADLQYEAEVKELLGEREYNTHTYEYEHPSVIADREREAKRLEEEVEPSPSDLSPLIHKDSLGTITRATFFIMSDNETDVDRILSAFASAQTGLQSKSLDVCDFTVLNNSKWNRYTNIDRAMFFRSRVTAFTSYHAKRDSDIIKQFDSRYAQEFGSLPSLYSYRGYDVAKIFGEGLYSDIEYGMEGRTFTPLQTTYRFQKMRDKSVRANQNWTKANYKNNYTITIE